MKNHAWIALACSALVTVCVPAGEKPAAEGFDWMSGHWCLDKGNDHIEEYWLPQRGGMLLGISRTTRGERAAGFELMRIVTGDSEARFIAQPEGGPPVIFEMTTRGPTWARFENPEHDFPTRVEYRREGDLLRASIAGPGKEGKERVVPFEYRRCPE
jgi:hypothetical protein